MSVQCWTSVDLYQVHLQTKIAYTIQMSAIRSATLMDKRFVNSRLDKNNGIQVMPVLRQLCRQTAVPAYYTNRCIACLTHPAGIMYHSYQLAERHNNRGYLMASIHHEVQTKELKAVLPPHGVQLVQHRTKSMSGTCSHLRY